MWTEKYKPASLEQISGNLTLINNLKSCLWKKPLLLYGSIGIGKTTLIEAFAKDCGYNITWINEKNINKANEISRTSGLFSYETRERRILVFDNVDTISDVKKVTEFVKKTKTPTILITSDFKNKRLSTIKKSCEKVQMRKPMSSTITNILENISRRENIPVEKDILKKIAENSGGDIRASILDFETIAKGREKINENDLEILFPRDKVSDIFKALGTILTKKDIPLKEIIGSTYDLTEQPRDVLLWIDEHLPKFFVGRQNIKEGFESLSRADIFLGRITRRQYWGFLRYANSLMTAGVNVAKSEKINFSRYQFPFYIIHMGQTKKERNLKKNIAEKCSQALHASGKVINNEFIPLFKILLKNNKITGEELKEKFNFDDEEINFLNTG